MKATEKIMVTKNIQPSYLRFHVSKNLWRITYKRPKYRNKCESILFMLLDYDIFLLLTLPQLLKKGENQWQSHTIECENCLWTRKWARRLRKAVAIAPKTMTKLRRDEPVNLAILERIRNVLDCDFGDVMQYVKETSPAKPGRKEI